MPGSWAQEAVPPLVSYCQGNPFREAPASPRRFILHCSCSGLSHNLNPDKEMSPVLVAEASPGAVPGVRVEMGIFFPEHMGGSTADKTGLC